MPDDLSQKNTLNEKEQRRVGKIYQRLARTQNNGADIGYGGYIDPRTGYGQETRREKETSLLKPQGTDNADNLQRQYRAAMADTPQARRERLLAQQNELMTGPARFAEKQRPPAETPTAESQEETGEFVGPEEEQMETPASMAARFRTVTMQQRFSETASDEDEEDVATQQAQAVGALAGANTTLKRLTNWPPTITGKIATMLRVGILALGGLWILDGMDRIIGENATDKIILAMCGIGVLSGMLMMLLPIIYMLLLGGAVISIFS